MIVPVIINNDNYDIWVSNTVESVDVLIVSCGVDSECQVRFGHGSPQPCI